MNTNTEIENKTIQQFITEIIDKTTSINDIPIDIRERVQRGVETRLSRHEGHSTDHNADGTVTVINDRLRVTLPESEFRGRGHVFTTAMRVLAHRYEEKQPVVEPAEDEIYQLAFKHLTYEYLAQYCRYDLSNIIMRLEGNYRMSEGMDADVSAAHIRAGIELRDNPTPHLAEARKTLEYIIDTDTSYHKNIAEWCPNWQIEIIGPMPEQIGLCRYQEGLTC